MFRVSARTVLQLGAELISSDAVAFYELIKNAFDAGSPKVTVRIVVRIPFDITAEATSLIASHVADKAAKSKQREAIAECQEFLLGNIKAGAPGTDELKEALESSDSWDELRSTIDDANYIEIADTGSGMSLADLDEIYLTIGTRSRLRDRELAAKNPGTRKRPVLGEKGLGRLSAMRLGAKLSVTSSKADEKLWNSLEIDWRAFAHDSDALLEEIDIEPTRGDRKSDPAECGTTLRISALTADWDAVKVQQMADSQFSKLTDPYTPKSRFPIRVSFNGRAIAIPAFDELLFKYAHAEVHATFTLDGPQGPRLAGKVVYSLRNRENTFELDGAHLVSAAGIRSLKTLKSLGPFTTQCVWINRKTLKELEDDVEEVKRVIALQEQWAGGLMVYRDGFRVYPYGSPDDDWLDLDKKALSSGGYKVNRRQVVGKVDISSTKNPALLDQSNREGLRDSAEKQALILLLKYVLEAELRQFLNRVDKAHKASEPVTFEELEDRIDESEERIIASLQALVERHPEVGKDAKVVRSLKHAVQNLRQRLQDAKDLAESFEEKHAQIVHLAATGFMVEMLAHELNRATANTLETLSDADREALSPPIKSLLSILRSELHTLQKRLSILDPLSTSMRHRKDSFELTQWVQEVMDSYESRFENEGISCRLRVAPKGSTLRVKAVKGMITQILSNLISNSVYWLRQEKKLDRDLEPEIRVVIDTERGLVSFSDNGPGIPVARRDEVFEPFVTTKPPGEGKGLGLYIAREVANYNGATLTLSTEGTGSPKRLHTFILALKGEAE